MSGLKPNGLESRFWVKSEDADLQPGDLILIVWRNNDPTEGFPEITSRVIERALPEETVGIDVPVVFLSDLLSRSIFFEESVIIRFILLESRVVQTTSGRNFNDGHEVVKVISRFQP